MTPGVVVAYWLIAFPALLLAIGFAGLAGALGWAVIMAVILGCLWWIQP